MAHFVSVQYTFTHTKALSSGILQNLIDKLMDSSFQTRNSLYFPFGISSLFPRRLSISGVRNQEMAVSPRFGLKRN